MDPYLLKHLFQIINEMYTVLTNPVRLHITLNSCPCTDHLTGAPDFPLQEKKYGSI